MQSLTARLSPVYTFKGELSPCSANKASRHLQTAGVIFNLDRKTLLRVTCGKVSDGLETTTAYTGHEAFRRNALPLPCGSSVSCLTAHCEGSRKHSGHRG